MTSSTPLVAVIMGSQSDYETMRHACDTLSELGVPFEAKVVSAHRTPDAMFTFAEEAEGRGLLAIIAGAGGAAHLPGMVAAKTQVPVIGVPVPATMLNGVDALMSIVQMPKGVPVATVAIGKPGASNAGILAAQIVANSHVDVRAALKAYREKQRDLVLAQTLT
jgi:5-(carboxyamino)imidazole ribonucleotide mutase